MRTGLRAIARASAAAVPELLGYVYAADERSALAAAAEE
jgi:hypothetical protein